MPIDEMGLMMDPASGRDAMKAGTAAIDLADIRKRHRKVDHLAYCWRTGNPNYQSCGWCENDEDDRESVVTYPCDAVVLADELEAERKRADRLERENTEIRQQVSLIIRDWGLVGYHAIDHGVVDRLRAVLTRQLS